MAAGTRTFVMKFVGDTKSLISEMGKIDDKFAGMSGKGKMIAGAAVVGGAAIGAAAVSGFTKAIQIAANYEQAIDQVGAVANASEAQTKRLYETGKRIGKETAFSATEAAAAMEELAAQGLSVDQIVGGAADATVALAAAGKTDLVTAATAAAQTMGVFGVKAENMTDVVNRMAGAANFSKFGVEDMSLALGQGAGVAAASGVTYSDFLTTIAATANSFTSGADAGTGFKTFLQRMVPTGKAATNAMRDLGLITKDGHNRFFTAQGDFAGMANAAEILKEGLGDLSDEARTDALKDIFGSDASRTAASLSKQGAAGFNAIDQGMKNTDAAAVAAQRMDNLAGAIERLKGSLETMAISLGEKFLPGLTKAADFLAEWLPKIPTDVLLGVGAFAALIGVVSSVALVLAPLAMLAGGLGIGLGALLLPIGLVIAAIAGIIAVGILLYRNWDTIKDRAGDLAEWVVMAFQRITQALGIDGLLSEFVSRTVANFQNLWTLLKPIIMGVVGLITGIADAIGGVLDKIGQLGMGSENGDVAKARAKYHLPDNMEWGTVTGEASNGGIVPGPRGSSQLWKVHGGETILPTHKGGGYGGTTIIVQGNVYDEAGFQRALLSALNNSNQRGALGFT